MVIIRGKKGGGSLGRVGNTIGRYRRRKNGCEEGKIRVLKREDFGDVHKNLKRC